MNTVKHKEWRNFSIFFIVAFTVSLILCIAITLILTQKISNASYERYQKEISSELDSRARALEKIVDEKRREVEFIAAMPSILGNLRATENKEVDPVEGVLLKQWIQRLETIFTSYLSTHPDVIQARYIGVENDGKELVRVERKDGSIFTRSGNALQNKSSEDYYKNIIKLTPGEIFFSDINLNREHDKIELPYWPTYRVAKPIFTEKDNIFGFVILNFDASPLIDGVTSTHNKSLYAYLLNSDGGFLSHPLESKVFEFEFNPDVVWKNEFLNEHQKYLEEEFLRQRSRESPEIIITKERQIPIANVKAGKYLSVIVTKPQLQITQEIAKKRNYIIASLVVVFGFMLAFIAFYHCYNNKAFNLLQAEALETPSKNQQEVNSEGKPPLAPQASKVAPPASNDKHILTTTAKEGMSWDKDAALKRLRGREDRLKYLLKLFLKGLPESCNELHAACEIVLNTSDPELLSNGYKEIKRVAHKVKGVAGNISAREVFSLCEELERSAEEKDAASLASHFRKFDKTINAMTDAMQTYLKQA